MNVLAEGKFIRLVERKGWEFVDRVNVRAIVVILAITDDKEMILVEQYREPFQRSVIEMPAGLVGDIPGHEDEDILQAAQRELLEETGYKSEQMIYLTEGPPSAGQSTEVATLLRAVGLQKVGPGGGDSTENIIVHCISLNIIEQWLKDMFQKDKMVDPKIYAGLYYANRTG